MLMKMVQDEMGEKSSKQVFYDNHNLNKISRNDLKKVDELR